MGKITSSTSNATQAFIFFILLCLVSSCAKQQCDGNGKFSADDFLAIENILYDGYFDGDISLAKDSILKYIEYVKKIENTIDLPEDRWFVYYRYGVALARLEFILACQREKEMDLRQAISILKPHVIGFENMDEQQIKKSLILIIRNDLSRISWASNFEEIIANAKP